MNISKMLWLLLLICLGKVCYGEHCVPFVPASAREIISEFHGWRIVGLTDLPGDDQKLWRTSHDGKCPGIAAGNFMGGEKLSFAIALIRNQPSGRILEQLIVLSPEGDSFRRTTVIAPTDVVSPFVVWKVAPGNYKGVYQDKTVRIAHDSFVYEKMEAYATQYYYIGNRLHSIVTAN